MSTPPRDPRHPAAQIQDILCELDRRLHEVIRYTAAPTFDPLAAAEVMGRFDSAYDTLGRHRFCGLLVELDELNSLDQQAEDQLTAPTPSAQPTDP